MELEAKGKRWPLIDVNRAGVGRDNKGEGGTSRKPEICAEKLHLEKRWERKARCAAATKRGAAELMAAASALFAPVAKNQTS